MSRPNALPVGPTRLAESSTSMPPPEPRSSTVSPAFSCASAVGLPQPSDARRAVSGTRPDSDSLYRLLVMGSALPPQQLEGADPQQELPPVAARRAACPYFSFTISLMFSVVVVMAVFLIYRLE